MGVPLVTRPFGLARCFVIVAALALSASTACAGPWTREVVDSTFNCGIGCAAAVDEGGALHLSYARVGQVRYAARGASGWIREDVPLSPNAPSLEPEGSALTHWIV